MWACAIDECAFGAGAVEDLLAHQLERHERHHCAVCHTIVPDGYFAIRHAFDEHSRVDYLRHYDADADDVRRREAVLEAVEAAADVEAVVERLDDEVDL
jgi:predicted  nucleic acid-binding Zn-ribbon protein